MQLYPAIVSGHFDDTKAYFDRARIVAHFLLKLTNFEAEKKICALLRTANYKITNQNIVEFHILE